jgi:hypothetical protein
MSKRACTLTIPSTRPTGRAGDSGACGSAARLQVSAAFVGPCYIAPYEGAVQPSARPLRMMNVADLTSTLRTVRSAWWCRRANDPNCPRRDTDDLRTERCPTAPRCNRHFSAGSGRLPTVSEDFLYLIPTDAQWEPDDASATLALAGGRYGSRGARGGPWTRRGMPSSTIRLCTVDWLTPAQRRSGSCSNPGRRTGRPAHPGRWGRSAVARGSSSRRRGSEIRRLRSFCGRVFSFIRWGTRDAPVPYARSVTRRRPPAPSVMLLAHTRQPGHRRITGLASAGCRAGAGVGSARPTSGQ